MVTVCWRGMVTVCWKGIGTVCWRGIGTVCWRGMVTVCWRGIVTVCWKGIGTVCWRGIGNVYWRGIIEVYWSVDRGARITRSKSCREKQINLANFFLHLTMRKWHVIYYLLYQLGVYRGMKISWSSLFEYHSDYFLVKQKMFVPFGKVKNELVLMGKNKFYKAWLDLKPASNS